MAFTLSGFNLRLSSLMSLGPVELAFAAARRPTFRRLLGVCMSKSMTFLWLRRVLRKLSCRFVSILPFSLRKLGAHPPLPEMPHRHFQQ